MLCPCSFWLSKTARVGIVSTQWFLMKVNHLLSVNHHLIAAIPRQISPISFFLRRRSFIWTTLAMRLSFRSSRAHFFMSLPGLNDTAALENDDVDADPKGILTAVRHIRRWHRFCLPLLLLNLFVCLVEFRLDALGVLGWPPAQQSGKSGKPGTPPFTAFSLPSCIDAKWQFRVLVVTEVVDLVSGDAAVLMYSPRWSLWRGGNTNDMLSMSLTMEVPIDRFSLVALAKSSSTEEEDDMSETVLMGVDGGARSNIGDERLVMFFRFLFKRSS